MARIEKIVDLDAETEDDILPSYVGKMIVQCPQCMTLFYKNPEDIEYSEENPDVVNINEVCQHCGNTSGYTLVGKVDKVGEDEADKYDTDEVDDILDANEEANGGEEQPAEEQAQEEAPTEENTEELPELPELPAEEEEEKEETNESLNNSEAQKAAEKNSELATENKSENLTLNESANGDETTQKVLDMLNSLDGKTDKEKTDLIADLEIPNTSNEEREAKKQAILNMLNGLDESINNSEAQKDAEKNSDLATENKSENLTLNEGVTVEVDLADVYEPWEGAVDTWNKIVEADAVEAFEDYLKGSFPDGNDLTLTKINDIL